MCFKGGISSLYLFRVRSMQKHWAGAWHSEKTGCCKIKVRAFAFDGPSMSGFYQRFISSPSNKELDWGCREKFKKNIMLACESCYHSVTFKVAGCFSGLSLRGQYDCFVTTLQSHCRNGHGIIMRRFIDSTISSQFVLFSTIHSMERVVGGVWVRHYVRLTKVQAPAKRNHA